jgi:hypothetical protein
MSLQQCSDFQWWVGVRAEAAEFQEVVLEQLKTILTKVYFIPREKFRDCLKFGHDHFLVNNIIRYNMF